MKPSQTRRFRPPPPDTPVPSEFPQEPFLKIAIVGEAPSLDEVDKQRPFIGPSGRILNAMLRTVNIERDNIMVTNVFNQMLPDKSIAGWCAPVAEARAGGFDDLPSVGSAGYLRPEYRHHLARLADELSTVRPNIIVPMGPLALWAFTGDTSVGANRGTLLPAKYLLPGVKLLPTHHPSFVQKQWKFFPVVTADILKAVREAATPRINLPVKRLFIEPTLDDIRAIVPELLNSDLLSVDIETGWGQITCLGFAPNSERGYCIPFWDLRNPNRSYWPDGESEVEALRIVKAIMESNTPKLGQNFAGYDAMWFLRKYGIEPRNLEHDTRLMHHALYPELPKDLEFMGASYTSQGAWKKWGRRQLDKREA